LRPTPIDPFIQRSGDLTYFTLAGLVEVQSHGQYSGKQQRRINERQLAAPSPCARTHVKKMEIEPLIADGARGSALLAGEEKAQRNEGARGCDVAGQPAAFHANDIAGQGKADYGDTRWRPGARGIGHQAIQRVHVTQEVRESSTVKSIDERVI
jgi:hypothetical protein